MEIFVTCPHCKDFVEILQINCSIFRHGVYKHNNVQINPHSPKELCDHLLKTDQIYGCGKPFRLIYDGKEYSAIICDYI